ncbi:MAG: tRNA (adenosine(37)-N6)-threonylcarbamoyltransferase complex ATPase subunit type 1 TsaE [Bacteroidetes bacterium]|nr:MAG: tRNA (adenosine(37)-N6)-threonylcarbamoyltransferase complex ATPase subunit type 1 TsaE [Bacteroidota bacterium]
MELLVKHPRELDACARALLQTPDLPRVWTFSGPLGAGKTALIQALCRQLGVEEPVTSPTFALINVYACSPDFGGSVFHIDLYRLESVEEALQLGIEEYLDSGRFCFIEWPELLEPLLPERCAHVRIEPLEDSSRKILFLLD